MKLIKSRFVAERDLVSKIIQFVEGGSQVCHCGFSFDANEQAALGLKGPYLEAHDTRGVAVYDDAFYTGSNTVVFQRVYGIPVTDEQYALITSNAIKRIGSPYDFKDIFGIWLHQPWHQENGFECAAFLTAMQWLGGVQLLNVEPDYQYKITPEMARLSNLYIGRLLHEYNVG